MAMAADTPMVGGNGGAPFRLTCPAGQFLVGVYGRTGLWIDQIGAICAQWDSASQTLGRPVLNPRRFGGEGGGKDAAVCPGDSAISGWEIRKRRNNMVEYVAPECRAMLPPRDVMRVGRLSYGQRSAPPPQAPLAASFSEAESWHGCPQGELAIGFQGGWGDYIDRLGLICGPAPAKRLKPLGKQHHG